MFDERKLDVLNWIGLTGDLAFRAKMVFPHRLDPLETPSVLDSCHSIAKPNGSRSMVC
jgi:hypothetical protein